jgi:hypothetical protein
MTVSAVPTLDPSLTAGAPHAATEVKRRRELLRQTGLLPLRCRTAGSPEILVGVIDGVIDPHPSLARARIQRSASLTRAASLPASAHATFIASILVGQGPGVLGLCPGCTLLSLPVIDAGMLDGTTTPQSAADTIARAVHAAVQAGCQVIQLGIEVTAAAGPWFGPVVGAIRAAADRGIRTVVPSGNGAGITASPLVSAPGAVPVAAGRRDGGPQSRASLSLAVAQQGLLAPGTGIPGAGPADTVIELSGSSYAVPFATASFVLLRSLAFRASAAAVWHALLTPDRPVRTPHGVVPASLDAGASWARLTGDSTGS